MNGKHDLIQYLNIVFLVYNFVYMMNNYSTIC